MQTAIINYLKFWEYLWRSPKFKAEGLYNSTKQYKSMVACYFWNTEKCQSLLRQQGIFMYITQFFTVFYDLGVLLTLFCCRFKEQKRPKASNASLQRYLIFKSNTLSHAHTCLYLYIKSLWIVIGINKGLYHLVYKFLYSQVDSRSQSLTWLQFSSALTWRLTWSWVKATLCRILSSGDM
jgi:hypothetical protein